MKDVDDYFPNISIADNPPISKVFYQKPAKECHLSVGDFFRLDEYGYEILIIVEIKEDGVNAIFALDYQSQQEFFYPWDTVISTISKFSVTAIMLNLNSDKILHNFFQNKAKHLPLG